MKIEFFFGYFDSVSEKVIWGRLENDDFWGCWDVFDVSSALLVSIWINFGLFVGFSDCDVLARQIIAKTKHVQNA